MLKSKCALKFIKTNSYEAISVPFHLHPCFIKALFGPCPSLSCTRTIDISQLILVFMPSLNVIFVSCEDPHGFHNFMTRTCTSGISCPTNKSRCSLKSSYGASDNASSASVFSSTKFLIRFSGRHYWRGAVGRNVNGVAATQAYNDGVAKSALGQVAEEIRRLAEPPSAGVPLKETYWIQAVRGRAAPGNRMTFPVTWQTNYLFRSSHLRKSKGRAETTFEIFVRR